MNLYAWTSAENETIYTTSKTPSAGDSLYSATSLDDAAILDTYTLNSFDATNNTIDVSEFTIQLTVHIEDLSTSSIGNLLTWSEVTLIDTNTEEILISEWTGDGTGYMWTGTGNITPRTTTVGFRYYGDVDPNLYPRGFGSTWRFSFSPTELDLTQDTTLNVILSGSVSTSIPTDGQGGND